MTTTNYTNAFTAIHRSPSYVNRALRNKCSTGSFPTNYNTSNASILSFSSQQPTTATESKTAMAVKEEIEALMSKFGDNSQTAPPRALLAGQDGADINRIRKELRRLLGVRMDAKGGARGKYARKWKWLYTSKVRQQMRNEEIMIIFERAVRERWS